MPNGDHDDFDDEEPLMTADILVYLMASTVIVWATIASVTITALAITALT